eukprot:CAMPEP_0168589434 /NCGR_PEP_ID=MMETSP0420-20121227/6010_1 /TAXON_ID=498008 /ORGANISM="Pessonella sp." /LENGTH=795 /DNA_ID=CAMNT_0008624981 /DNA_START=45 /DNA_END=2432 /DNA_ORIENTATION=+
MDYKLLLLLTIVLSLQLFAAYVRAEDADVGIETSDEDASNEPASEDLSFEAQAQANAEKHTFGAEVNKLMSIIINSLYTNNEVFLRELISNASDALDKIRFLSLTDPSALGETRDLEIFLRGDEKQNTLTLRDTGVGMTRQDMINNLGTIAQSGTKEFLKKFQEYSDSNLIGQFGVGFYSVFLVADSVTVVSKHNDDKQQVWQSTADGSFTVSEDPRGNTLGRGTQIIIHLKEDATEYARVDTLKRLVGKYSEFINFPIKLWDSREEEKEVAMNEEELAEQLRIEQEDAAAESDDDESEEEEVDLDEGDKESDSDDDTPKLPKKTTKTEYETVWEYQTLNDVKPLWTRSTDDITDEEYKEFYKSAMKEFLDPLKWTHFSAEGEIEFKALLFIPSSPPQGMFEGATPKDNMKLFVRRVFITDDFSDILPKYLSFIKGLVDSDDLPLNVSREQLQQHKTLKIIKKKLIRKAIAMFQTLAKDGGEDWDKFWDNYGTNIKLGVIEDASNRARLSKLLQFVSSKTGELTTLEAYVERMKKDQDQIYYLGGETRDAVEKSPLLERVVKRGFEVLIMTEPIDEYAVANMPKFDGKYTLTNIGKEGLVLPGDDAINEKFDELKDEFKPLFDWLKDALDNEDLDKVILSKRLTTSPSAIVSPSFGYTANMQRIVRNQALGDPQAKTGYMMNNKLTMELNPFHPIVKRLLAHVQAEEAGDEDKDVARLLFDTAKLQSGFPIEKPADFGAAVVNFLSKSLGVQDDEVEEFEEGEAPDQEEEEEEDEDEEDEEDEEEEEATEDKDEL